MNRIQTFWQGHFLGMEAMMAGLMATIYSVWFFMFDGKCSVDEFMQGNRSIAYTTIAGIAGTLLGFSIAVASLVLNILPSPRMELVRKSKHYPKIGKTLTSTGKMLGFLTVVALICLVADTDRASIPWLTIPLCFFLILSAWRVLRVLWILEYIIEIVVKKEGALVNSHRKS